MQRLIHVRTDENVHVIERGFNLSGLIGGRVIGRLLKVAGVFSERGCDLHI